MNSASTSGSNQSARQVSRKPSFNKKPLPSACQTSNGRLAAFKKLVRRSIRTLNQKNTNNYHRNCQRTRYSLEQQLNAISHRTKAQEQLFKQKTETTCSKTLNKMSGEQTARNVPTGSTTTGPTASHIPRFLAPTIATPKTCVKPLLDSKKLTLTDTKAVKSTTSLTAKSIKSNLMSKFSTPTSAKVQSTVSFGSAKAPSSAAPSVSTPSIRKNIFSKTPIANRQPATPSTTSRLVKPEISKTPATRQPLTAAALNDKKLSRTADCARTIKRRSVNYLKKNDGLKTPGRIPVRTTKQYPQTEVKKNMPRAADTREINETPGGKSTGKRLSLSNFKSHCLIITPTIMQHLFRSAAKSTKKSSQQAPTVVEEEEDEELIQIHSIKPTSLLKFILSEKTDGETPAGTEVTVPPPETNTPIKQEEKQEPEKLDDTIVIQQETMAEESAPVQLFVPDTQDQILREENIIVDSLPDIIEDSVPFTEQTIETEPIQSVASTNITDVVEEIKEQEEESHAEIQMDILTQTETSTNEEIEQVTSSKIEEIVEKANEEPQQEVIPDTYQAVDEVHEEKVEEPQVVVVEETEEVETVEEKPIETMEPVEETVPETVQEKQEEEAINEVPVVEEPVLVNIEAEIEGEKENDPLFDQEKSSQTDFNDSIEIESNYDNDSQMEEHQAPQVDTVDTASALIEPIVQVVQNEDLDSTIQEEVQAELDVIDEPKQQIESSPAKPEPQVEPEIVIEEKIQVNEVVEEEEVEPEPEEEKPKTKRGGRPKKAAPTRGRAKKVEVQEEEENKENADSGPVVENTEKPKRGRKPKKVEEVETCCKLATVEETGRVLTRAQRAKLNQK